MHGACQSQVIEPAWRSTKIRENGDLFGSVFPDFFGDGAVARPRRSTGSPEAVPVVYWRRNFRTAARAASERTGRGARESVMVHSALVWLYAMAQLIGASGGLPQVAEADYSGGSMAAGRPGEVVLSLDVREGYLINHTPPMQLKLDTVAGLTLNQTEFVSDALDPDSTDVYYVNVPDFRIGVTADRAGAYEVPGELVYFFCSIADGFCARQTLDVSLPVVAE